jgi:hypothetical protein
LAKTRVKFVAKKIIEEKERERWLVQRDDELQNSFIEIQSKIGKAVDFRNSQQTALNFLSRLSVRTEIGRLFHMAGPQTKNECAVEASE